MANHHLGSMFFPTTLSKTTVIEGSLNSKLPTIWTVEKQSRVVKSAERRCNSAKVRRKKIHPRQMLEKSRNAVCFQWFVCSGQSKSRPVKAAGAEVGAQRRNQKLHAAGGEKHILKWKCTKHVGFGALFEVSDVEKLHTAVPKSTFGNEHVQNMTCSEHFLEFWCRKIARGEKHIWKWKCTKHDVFGALFEVLLSKNCTPLWRNAHLEVKMYKTWGVRSTFWSSDVEKSVR